MVTVIFASYPVSFILITKSLKKVEQWLHFGHMLTYDLDDVVDLA